MATAQEDSVTQRNRRVMFIGLGGTGKEVVSRLKSRLLDTRGEIPRRNSLLVIDVDNDQPKLGARLELDVDFIIPAEGTTPSQVERAVREGRDRRWALVRKRVPPGEMHFQFNTWHWGTQRYRQAGLLALLWGESGIREVLESRVTQLMMKHSDEVTGSIELHVFVVCSVCGGTGSGMFMDVVQTIRSLTRELRNTHVWGLLVLPSAFKADVKESTKAYLEVNALATLTELDFFLYEQEARRSRTCNPSDTAQVWYSPLRAEAYDTQTSLLTGCFLFDGMTLDGASLGGTKELFPAIAEILLYFSGAVTKDQRLADAFLSDVNNTYPQHRVHGTNKELRGHYGAIGLSRLTSPQQKVALQAAELMSEEVLRKLWGNDSPVAEAAALRLLDDIGYPDAKLQKRLNTVGREVQLRSNCQAHFRDRELTREVGALSATLQDEVRRARDQVVGWNAALERDLETYRPEILNQARELTLKDIGAHLHDGRGLSTANKSLALCASILARWKDANSRKAQDLQRRLDERRVISKRLHEDVSASPRSGVLKSGQHIKTLDRYVTACHEELQTQLDLGLARALETVMEEGRQVFERLREDAYRLAAFVNPAEKSGLQGEVKDVVRRELGRLEQRKPAIEIYIEVDGREVWNSPTTRSTREDLVRARVDSIIATLEDRTGRLRLDCRGEAACSVTSAKDKTRVADEWVRYLRAHLQAISQVPLDSLMDGDGEGTDGQGGVIAGFAQRLKEGASVFLQHNQGRQGGDFQEAGQVAIAAAPGDLTGMIDRLKSLGVPTVIPQDYDKYQAVYLKAELGIIKDALNLCCAPPGDKVFDSLMTREGLWLFGQLSWNIFWKQGTLWEALSLFVMAYVNGLIERKKVPSMTGSRLNYAVAGSDLILGDNLGSAIIEFCTPTRTQLHAEIRNAIERLPDAAQGLRERGADMDKQCDDPDEFRTFPYLKAVLRLRIRDLMGQQEPEAT